MKTSVFLSLTTTVLILGSNALLAAPKPKAPAKNATATVKAKRKVDLNAVKVRNIEFAFAKAEVPASYYPNLNKVAKLMIDNNASVAVKGHTDNKGGYLYNWKLSEARANAVKEYLANQGADTSRIAATEYGFTKPLAANSTSTGRKKNRRVEVNFIQ